MNARYAAATGVAVLALMIGLVTAAAAQDAGPSFVPTTPPQAPIGRPAMTSCDGAEWPETPVTCAEAAALSASLGMTITSTRIWLTPIGAVDAIWAPGRQVADHPTDPATPVWVFVHDGHRPPIRYANEAGELVSSRPESRLLHVVDATDPGSRDGAFVYLYGWSELGSPGLPEVMPVVGPTASPGPS